MVRRVRSTAERRHWHQPDIILIRPPPCHPQLLGTVHHSRGHVLSTKIIPPSCQQWLYRNPPQLHDHIMYERSLRRSRAVLSRWWIRVKWHKSIVTQNFSPANIHPSWERNKENVFKPSPCQFKITIFIMDHMDQSSVPDMTHNPSTTNLGFNKIFNNKIGNYQAEMNRKTLHVCIIWNIYYLAVTYCKSLSPGDWCPSDGVHNILTHIDLSIPLQLDITRTRDLREHNSSCHCSKSLIIMYLLKLI